jgi:ribonucleoside-diphosphate reductase alpha chain/ribonucleoside-triphosphate reductase
MMAGLIPAFFISKFTTRGTLMNVVKRNGAEKEFDLQKIIIAIESAMRETERGIDKELSLKIAASIEKELSENHRKTVDEISDMVERKLMSSNRKDVAKQYILYRENRNKTRNQTKYNLLSDEFISQYKHLPNPMTPLGEFVYYRTYSRWLPEESRREYWWETVRRTVEYNCSLVAGVTQEEAEKLYDNIFNLRQFLSGRTLWVGGTPIANEYGTSNFNCSFCIIDDFSKFKELFYLLMVGAGVGFRVLLSDVNKLSKVRTNIQVINKDYYPVYKNNRQESTSLEFQDHTAYITIGDSKEGWTQALDYFFKLFSEKDYKYIQTIIINYDNIRAKGEKLKKFGGTASGHEHLQIMFTKLTQVIHSLKNSSNDNNYKKLRPIHCMDICNIIGENVVSGGVRRTSEICLIDQNDKESIQAKNNLYYKDEDGWKENASLSHRRMSNNSIVYFEKPSYEQLTWQIQQMRNSGESAFVNLGAAFIIYL